MRLHSLIGVMVSLQTLWQIRNIFFQKEIHSYSYSVSPCICRHVSDEFCTKNLQIDGCWIWKKKCRWLIIDSCQWLVAEYLWWNCLFMMTSSNGIIFRVASHLCWEFTGHRWIPDTKASDAELWCFLWYAPWINGWVNNHEAGDFWRYHAHCDVIVMWECHCTPLTRSEHWFRTWLGAVRWQAFIWSNIYPVI